MPQETQKPPRVGDNASSHPFDFERFLRRLVIAVVVTVLVGGTALTWHSFRRSRDLVVHVAYLPIYVDLPLFVAYQQGFFQKRGVRVQLDRFATSPEMGQALASKNASVAASVAFATVLSAESRDPGKLKIFLVDGENDQNYLSSIVILPNSGITSIEGLKGKKVGSFPGPQAVTFFKLLLAKHHLTPGKDVDVVELPSGSHISALQSHTVNALFTYEPIATQAVQEIGAVKLVPGAIEREIINPWQAGVWVLSAEFVASHPNEARAVIAAIYDAVDFIRKDPTTAKIALNDNTSIPAAVAQATPTIPFTRIGEINLQTLQQHADILRSSGLFSKAIAVSDLLIPPTLLLDSPR